MLMFWLLGYCFLTKGNKNPCFQSLKKKTLLVSFELPLIVFRSKACVVNTRLVIDTLSVSCLITICCAFILSIDEKEITDIGSSREVTSKSDSEQEEIQNPEGNGHVLEEEEKQRKQDDACETETPQP